MRRDEAFFAEQFAHLFAVIASNEHHAEALPRLAADVSALDAAGHLALREELRRMRARYQLSPYLFTQLDRAVK